VDEDNLKLNKELEAENKEHGDLVLVDMIDSYRALPQKLRLFYRHLAERVNYDYGTFFLFQILVIRIPVT